MNKTITYYDTNAKEYANSTRNTDMSLHYEKFLKHIEKRSHILDAGCGSGRDSKYFLNNGYTITAFDGSKELSEEAQKFIGQPVEHVLFNELSYNDEFDAIWACASLLHLTKEELNDTLIRFHKALKNDGILYISMKYGKGEEIDNKGRYFSYFSEEDFNIIKDAGFSIIEHYITGDSQNRNDVTWINIIVRKSNEPSVLRL